MILSQVSTTGPTLYDIILFLIAFHICAIFICFCFSFENLPRFQAIVGNITCCWFRCSAGLRFRNISEDDLMLYHFVHWILNSDWLCRRKETACVCCPVLLVYVVQNLFTAFFSTFSTTSNVLSVVFPFASYKLHCYLVCSSLLHVKLSLSIVYPILISLSLYQVTVNNWILYGFHIIQDSACSSCDRSYPSSVRFQVFFVS